MLLYTIWSLSLRLPAAPAPRAAILRRDRVVAPVAQAPSSTDRVIEELLGASEASVLSVMSHRLDALTDPDFMAQLERRRATAGSAAEAAALAQLGDAVCNFLEELIGRVQEMEPQWREQEESVAAQAVQAARAAQPQAAKPRPTRGGSDAAPPELPALPHCTEGESTDEAAARERRALNRFKLEQLLDAAHVNADALDSRLRQMSGELDASFFEHLRWEVEQQVAAKNERLLAILEVVVQRACVEAEKGHPEVELLAAALQTNNRELRREMFERRLATADPVVQRQFVANVQEARMQLEKAVLAGKDADRMLLQQLRVIALEMYDYVATP